MGQCFVSIWRKFSNINLFLPTHHDLDVILLEEASEEAAGLNVFILSVHSRRSELCLILLVALPVNDTLLRGRAVWEVKLRAEWASILLDGEMLGQGLVTEILVLFKVKVYRCLSWVGLASVHSDGREVVEDGSVIVVNVDHDLEAVRQLKEATAERRMIVNLQILEHMQEIKQVLYLPPLSRTCPHRSRWHLAPHTVADSAC